MGSRELRRGPHAIRIDRDRRRVEMSGGAAIEYGHLVLATGPRQRRLAVPGVDLLDVFGLRTIADAIAIRERLADGLRLVVVVAGFIGLEIAATARALGAEVTVVEIARPMGRAVSPIISDYFIKAHTGEGGRFRIGWGLAEVRGVDKAEAVVLTDGGSCRSTSSAAASGSSRKTRSLASAGSNAGTASSSTGFW
jgi:3-phenylpropionate/trans-cinnamate dioxygenase ferredoxin reductase subunit